MSQVGFLLCVFWNVTDNLHPCTETRVQGSSSVPSQAFKSTSSKNLFALNSLFIILSFSLIRCYTSREISGVNVVLYSKASSLFSSFGEIEVILWNVCDFGVLEPVVQSAPSVVWSVTCTRALGVLCIMQMEQEWVKWCWTFGSETICKCLPLPPSVYVSH